MSRAARTVVVAIASLARVLNGNSDDPVCVHPGMTGNGKTAVAYVRVSTEDQKLGPEAQRAAIEAWARAEGVTVVAWHVDQGLGGGLELEERAGLIAALADLKAHRAGSLVVAKRDRLARDVYIAGAIEREVAKTGARVVSADGTANGDTPADAFMRSILDAVAQYERALIRARTKAALGAKAARGERVGEIPYGFRLAPDGVRLEPDEGEQHVVATVRELHASGLSQRGIVRALAGRGVVSRSGKALGKTQVVRILEAA